MIPGQSVDVIDRAIRVLGARLGEPPAHESLTGLTPTHGYSINDIKNYLVLRCQGDTPPFIGLMSFDNRQQLCHDDTLSYEDGARCLVSPRTVVKTALRHEPAEVLLYQNSAIRQATVADRWHNKRMAQVLTYMDIGVLDVVMVRQNEVISLMGGAGVFRATSRSDVSIDEGSHDRR